MHDDEALAAAAGARALALGIVGRHWESAQMAEGLVALARRTGSVMEEARAFLTLGVTISEEDPRRALDLLRQCATLARRAGTSGLLRMALANAAEGAVDLGELDIAAAALAEALTEGAAPEGDIQSDATALTVAMLAAVRGDVAAASQSLDQMSVRRVGWEALPMTTWFLRVQGLLRLIEGDAANALEAVRNALELEPSGVNASTALWLGVQAACELADAATLVHLLDATTALRGRWIDAVRLTARAGIGALAGEPPDPGVSFEAALGTWLELDLPLDHALATACAVAVLPAAEVSRDDVARAREYLDRIGGHGVASRLDRMTARHLAS